jgi:hypothetical protein
VITTSDQNASKEFLTLFNYFLSEVITQLASAAVASFPCNVAAVKTEDDLGYMKAEYSLEFVHLRKYQN